MSGRGATSRKAIKKNIEKTEKKKDAKDFADELTRPPSESGWNLPIRGTSSNRRGSFTAASVSTHSSDRSKGSDKIRAATPGLFGSDPKDPKKYAVKGKETAAPRGRGGGVPLKTAQSTTETYHSNESYESDPKSPRGATPQLSAREKGWANMKLWPGNAQPTSRWRGFEHVGEVLIYPWTANPDSPRIPRCICPLVIVWCISAKNMKATMHHAQCCVCMLKSCKMRAHLSSATWSLTAKSSRRTTLRLLVSPAPPAHLLPIHSPLPI